MKVQLHMNDGSTATFHSQFNSEQDFWDFYSRTAEDKISFLTCNDGKQKVAYNLHAITWISFELPDHQ